MPDYKSDFDSNVGAYGKVEYPAGNCQKRYVYGVFRNLPRRTQHLIKDEENNTSDLRCQRFLRKSTKEMNYAFHLWEVGNQYKNYLIDEFQDTSGFQWE